MQTISQILAQELNCKQEYIENVIALLDEGNTIPFIARYRKEQHGAMDDTALRTLETRLQYLRNLAQRREEVKSSIEAQEKLTDELAKAIDEAKTLAEVEDLYRPYKPKRRTRATIAKEKGLEPLADAIFAQTLKMDAPEMLAQAYIDPEKGVETIEDALTGASDILAERISDDAEVRKSLRALMNRRGTAQSAAAKDEEDEKTAVYRQYFEFSQPISRLQSHQVLALNRGEREGALKVSLAVDRNEALQCIRRGVVRPGSPAMEFMKSVCDDSYDRLLEPSMERELRTALTDMANEQAIHNFALNLRPLLMQPPVKGAVTMGLDPGYSHGCKVAVVDETGKVLDTTVVYPTFGEKQKQDAIAKLSQLIKKDNVRHLAIGNGTASRETEAMAVEMIHKLGGGVSYMIVNEAGASVYSASKLAAEEFPQYDVNLRSAVSIARRLQDPLAELVKIDPKAIGVGQYQHDMPEKELDVALGGVVEACVNAVGVDLNTASAPLLKRVAGLNATTAKNIVAYREENGAFTSRAQIKKVPKLGPKAFEQCAGFLRVPESKQVLDRTGVHPESYDAAKKLAAMGIRVAVCDEREELFPTGEAEQGIDVMRGVDKAAAVEMLLRAMAPQAILCDEIGNERDAQALESAARCGVGLLASAHAGTWTDVLRRPILKRLYDGATFERYLLLGRHGRLAAAYDAEGTSLFKEDGTDVGHGGDGHDFAQRDRVCGGGWRDAARSVDSGDAPLYSADERRHSL